MSKHGRFSTLVPVLAVGLTLVLAACGEDSSVEDPGEAFEYTLPAGWSDEIDRAEQVGPPWGLNPASVRSMASMNSASSFTTVFVVVTPPGTGDLNREQFARAALREVRLAYSERAGAIAGATPPAADPGPSPPGRLTRTEVGGVPALRFDYATGSVTGSSGGKVRSVAVVHDGSPYLLRFVSGMPNFHADLDAFDEILDSWRWTDVNRAHRSGLAPFV